MTRRGRQDNWTTKNTIFKHDNGMKLRNQISSRIFNEKDAFQDAFSNEKNAFEMSITEPDSGNASSMQYQALPISLVVHGCVMDMRQTQKASDSYLGMLSKSNFFHALCRPAEGCGLLRDIHKVPLSCCTSVVQ